MRMSMYRALIFAVLLAPVANAQSGGVFRLAARPDSRLWLEGTSNIRSWSCRATSLDAYIDVSAHAALADPAAIAAYVQRVTIKVPVGSLKCGNGRMDRNMYRALKAGDDPQASFISGSFSALPVHDRHASFLRTAGTLTVAGENRTLDVEVRTHHLSDGTLVAEGIVPVNMSDFGIAPPTALFGAIRTGNRVMVRFELRVSTQAPFTVAEGN
jgi:polyisoprenoid-binding protein YceI